MTTELEQKRKHNANWPELHLVNICESVLNTMNSTVRDHTNSNSKYAYAATGNFVDVVMVDSTNDPGLKESSTPRKATQAKEYQTCTDLTISTDQDFFKNMKDITKFSDVLLERSFVPVPDNWTIVITDVVGSTKAIEAGRYKDVNALGAASIIGIKNALPGIELPFCFGGDGATLAVPTNMLATVDCALRGLKKLAENNFQLKLRTGRVSVQELQKAGHPVFAAKYRPSSGPPFACFRGSGIAVAEEWIKSENGAAKYNPDTKGLDELNLLGLECRWKPAHNQNGTICSIIIKAQPMDCVSERESVYSTAFSKVKVNSGNASGVLNVSNLQFQDINGDFSAEAKLLSKENKGGWKYFEKLHRARLDSMIGRFLCYWKLNIGGFFPGRTYLQDVSQNTDHLKFDEALRMVVDMPTEEADHLISWLEIQKKAGLLFYGVHRSDSALITCMINSYESDHLHFVDGADGGYALAAKCMKAQMKMAYTMLECTESNFQQST